jgi:hypothetical protein
MKQIEIVVLQERLSEVNAILYKRLVKDISEAYDNGSKKQDGEIALQ